jgi:serine/threonine protein phosphatase 1
MHIYAIGDIHGHLDLLRAAHDRIAADMARHGPGTVVHVGDLVDRGPDSRGVIDFLMAGMARGEDWVVLKGNHDRMFRRFVRDHAEPEPGLRPSLTWLHPNLGGAATLASYGVRSAGDRPVAKVHVDTQAAVPQDHLDFIDSLPAWHRVAGTVLVHAGVRPGVPMEEQTETDLVWIRAGFLDDTRDHGALVVHGHTAIDTPTHYGNRLNIDSSAAYGGPLSAVVLDAEGEFLLWGTGRLPIPRPRW